MLYVGGVGGVVCWCCAIAEAYVRGAVLYVGSVGTVAHWCGVGCGVCGQCRRCGGRWWAVYAVVCWCGVVAVVYVHGVGAVLYVGV